MTLVSFLVEFAASLAVGALVGIEREHRRVRGTVYAGVRTFPLISASGYLGAVLGEAFDSVAPVVAGFAVMGLGAVAFFYVRAQAGEIGFTTPMAFLVTFLAGALIGFGLILEGVVVAVATTALLLTKKRLHKIAETLRDSEVMGALQFVALAFIALPLAASASGPYLGGLVGQGRPIDPQWMLYIVVAVSALAFASFLALRRFGSKRGLTAAGALGGLINSQAATVSAAALAKTGRGLEVTAASAVLAAAATAFLRDVIIVAIADPSLRFAARLLPLVVLPALISGGAALWLQRRVPMQAEGGDLGIRNPFAIRPAILFAVVFGAVNAAAFYLQDLAGPWGVYATSVGALVSSGAVIASVATLVFKGTIPVYVGLVTAALALLFSLAARVFALVVVNRSLLGHVALPFGAAAAAIAVGLLILL